MNHRTPSPPEGQIPVTPFTPQGLRVFTESGSMWLSTSSRATEKIDQRTEGAGAVVVTEIPKLPGAERVVLAIRGQAGVNVRTAANRIDRFMEDQAARNVRQDAINHAHDRRLTELHHSLVDSYTEITMFSILSFVTAAMSGNHSFVRGGSYHPLKSELRQIVLVERGPYFRKFWSIDYARQLNDPITLERFLSGIDLPRRHTQAHLELNPNRLTSNAFEIERAHYRPGTEDNQYTLGVQYLLIVLRVYGWSWLIIDHIKNPTSLYPDIPASQLDRFSAFL